MFIVTVDQNALIFIDNSRVEKLLARLGIEPATLDLNAHSGAYDHSNPL